MGVKKKVRMYRSGYCAYNPHQHPCPGEFKNGSRAGNGMSLCSCDCHGDYEARLVVAGQRMPEPEVEDE